MTSPAQLERHIRFQLSDLRARNEHHRFEDLCRHFARLRICERVIPATGPVAKGGDQGRDFESYRSYLSSTPIATSTFLGTGDYKTLVFACSLQQDAIDAKIKKDVRTICGAGHVPDAIYCFCEANVEVSTRHQLQQWCRDNFSVHLEILDGRALAESLTNIDVFWIAQEFLSVPADLYPRPDKGPAWYQEHRRRWLKEERIALNYADFIEIKRGLRHATHDKEAKPDLPAWLKHMESFVRDDAPEALKLAAIYEVCVGYLRGLNNLTAKADLVYEFFSDFSKFETPTQLRDATTLLSYCSSAQAMGHFEIDPQLLHDWTVTLVETLKTRLEATSATGARCVLMQTLGQAGHLQFREGLEPNVDLSLAETVFWWDKMLGEVEAAPLFPIEEFADVLSVMIGMLGEAPKVQRIANQVDELLIRHTGGRVAAEKCRDRAVAHMDNERYLLAIKELHQSKVHWFSAETLRGSILSMLILSQCYQRLGLYEAAKYYALGALAVAHYQEDESLKDLVPGALFQLGECCYLAGEWLNFLHAVWLALAAQNTYASDPQELQEHDLLQQTLFHSAVARVITKRAAGAKLTSKVEDMIKSWPLDAQNRAEFEALCNDESIWLYKEPVDQLLSKAQDKIGSGVYCELGARRRIRWAALGIGWVVECANEYRTVRAAEEFASTLQILIGEFADRDLCLLPTNVSIEFCLSTSSTQFEVYDIPSNRVSTISLSVPSAWLEQNEHQEDLRAATLSAAATILGKCTLLTKEDFMQQIERAIAEGLTHKTFSVRSYAELIADYLPEAEFDAAFRQEQEPLGDPDYRLIEHAELRWRDEPGPRYSRGRAREFLENRYRQSIRPIRLSLKCWLQSSEFRDLIAELRNEGYLDWQILLILANIGVSYRVNAAVPFNADPQIVGERMKAEMFKEEEEADDRIPVSIFTKEAVDAHKIIQLASVVKTWGLTIHQATPDFGALRRFLAVRYMNETDDVEHEDVFGA